MKPNPLQLTTLALLPAIILTFTSCSTPPPDVNESATVIESDNAVSVVDTQQLIATVTAIDPATRKVTLKLADGKTKTVKCGPRVVNFGQIQVNDQVNVTVTEELAVFLGTGRPPSAAGVAAVALAPVGATPGGVMGDTVQITAQITAIDFGFRRVTLLLPDGSSKTVQASSQLDLSSVNVGDNVTVQHTESLAITVEKK